MSDRMEVLRRDFLIDDLQGLAQEHDVVGTVAVQSRQTLSETLWLLDIAERSSLIHGVVGWVPLVEPDVEEHLNRLSSRSKLRGVRHVLHDEPDRNYMLRTDFNEGVRLLERYGLAYDLLIFAEHLPQTIKFVDQHPNQIFVVDHIAKPRIASSEIEAWGKNLHALSQRQNVYCKVSGMVTEADWTTWTQSQMQPYFDTVLSAFGPSRMMFGSDWPVLTLASSYRRWIDTVSQMLSALSHADSEWVKQRTAVRAYRLTPSEDVPAKQNRVTTEPV